MGAFGRVLIQTWGGNLDAYDCVTYTSKDERTEEEIKEEKAILFKERKLSIARNYLSQITTHLMYGFNDHTEVKEHKFRESFKLKKTDDWVIDLMWKEYNEFVDKYLKNRRK